MIRWQKDTAIPYRQFAYVNNVAIGYIKPCPNAAQETWEWGLTAIGLLVGIECKGECRTAKGAKSAMTRNWERSLRKLGLKET